jgi:hypothetical protein
MASLSELPYGAPERSIALPGGLVVDFTIINYANYIKTVRSLLLWTSTQLTP